MSTKVNKSVAATRPTDLCDKQDIIATHFDIIIVGGGLVGACMVAAIQADPSCSNLSIAIIEAQENNYYGQKADSSTPFSSGMQSSFDGKAIALSYGSALCLQQWQVWDKLKPFVQPIDKIEVSEKGSAGFSFIHKNAQKTGLGYVVEAQQIGAVLLELLAKNQSKDKVAKVTWFCPEKIKHLQQTVETAEIILQSGKRISSKLLFACDGANSQTRQALNLATVLDDYQQWAIVANVAVDKAHQSIAYERFTQHGPLAMLPMQGERFGLVWCLSQTQAEYLCQQTDEDFIAQLQQTFGYKAGKIIKVGQRQTYPLKRSFNLQNIHHRVVFLGNASHTVHPIAGQGFNLGIRDIACAAKTIGQKQQQQQDIGLQWENYLVSRTADIQLILQSTDTLVRTFSNDEPMLRLARNIGLFALEFNPILKQSFANRAMGLTRL